MSFRDSSATKTFNIIVPQCQKHLKKCWFVKLSSDLLNQQAGAHKKNCQLQLACNQCETQNVDLFINNQREEIQKVTIPILNFQHHNKQNQLKTDRSAHKDQIIPIAQFSEKLSSFLNRHKHYLKRDGLIIDIGRIFLQKKNQLMQYYENIKLSIINKLNKQQQKMLHEYQQAQLYYENKQKQNIAKLEQRTYLLEYIEQFIDTDSKQQQNQSFSQMLHMKLYMSNQNGLNNFINQISGLTAMHEQYQSRNINDIIDSIKKDLDCKMSCCLLKKVQILCNQPISLNRNKQCIISFEDRCRQKSVSSRHNVDDNSRQQCTDRRANINTQRTQRTQSYENLPKIPITPKTIRHERSYLHLPQVHS